MLSKADQLYKNNAKPEKAKRLKKCHYCGERKVPYGDMRTFCLTNECIMAHNTKQKKQNKQKADKELKEKSVSHWIEKADKEFNAFIRLRDKNEPCISCQVPANKLKKINAGHYRPKGRNAQLRYNESNVHKQCEACNTSLSGNLTEYRINLVKKIGVDAVEALECDNTTKKWTIDELREIIEKYKQKTRELNEL